MTAILIAIGLLDTGIDFIIPRTRHAMTWRARRRRNAEHRDWQQQQARKRRASATQRRQPLAYQAVAQAPWQQDTYTRDFLVGLFAILFVLGIIVGFLLMVL